MCRAARWNDPPAAPGTTRKADAKNRFPTAARPAGHDGAGRQVLEEHEKGPVMKAGGVGLRTNVIHRDVEGGVAELLPLRREAREAARRADTLRENVVKSKIALVKTRVALEKRILASQSGLGGGTQFVGVGGGGEAGGGLLETEDHLKFGYMLGKVCEVDEEVTALRQTVLTSEREARALRVQKNKLDLLGASLKSQRLLRELLNPTTSPSQMSAEIQVPHLDELNYVRTNYFTCFS